MAHCFRAGMMAVATERAAEAELKASLARAEALADRADERERGHIAALHAWADGDFAGANARWGAVLIDHPHDIVALQLAHLGDFYLGQSSLLRDRVARLLPDWSEDIPGFGYVLGMHAFGLEEMGDYGRAEASGRRALELNPHDPWAVHAVAHVMEMHGRLDDGVTWMTSRADDWAPENMFAYHNWWHLALYHLDLGQTERALELYDTRIHPGTTDVALELLDASSLLWRLALRDVDVGARWGDLADTWERLDERAYYAFNDVHAMMSFVGAGRSGAAAKAIDSLERAAAEGGTNAMMARDVGLPVARALQAFGAGNYATTVSLLMPVRQIAHRFGGSHAQRDILSLTLIEAALRDGQGRLARALVAERTDLKPTVPFNWSLAARAWDLAGDKAGAEEARRRLAAVAP